MAIIDTIKDELALDELEFQRRQEVAEINQILDKTWLRMPQDIKTLDDVIQLCGFAHNVTNLDDEYSKGMREAFKFIIKCCKESN